MKRNTTTFLRAAVQAALALALILVLFLVVHRGMRSGVRELHVLSTNDVHGAWFDSTYVGKRVRPSLFAVNYYVDSLRRAVGRRNVVLLDAGDCLQGDNAAYYYNYVATDKPHIFPELVSYMGYDAIAVGNHDIETGHPVYDRVSAQLRRKGVPFLAGNAVRTDNGKSYWPDYRLLHRSGLKVLVLGYTNANMAAWLGEEIWSGMRFESLLPMVQRRVDELRRRLRPDVVIVAVHSGTGKGDGAELESQGLDLYRSLQGVDFLLCSHDHRPFLECDGSKAVMNSGSRAHHICHGVLRARMSKGHVAGKEISVSMMDVDAKKADPAMRARFAAAYKEVKDFTLREVGEVSCPLDMREAFTGPCAMVNLIHLVQLDASGADVSFAAPLSQRGHIDAGKLVFNDMFTVYPYENTLFKIRLTGNQIRSYLEYSYDRWIRTPSQSNPHVLRIVARPDPRFGRDRWSFENRSYNFDSAAGLNYTVDVSKPFGQRVVISGMAGGEAFDGNKSYTVAMTSYRAAGAGGMLGEGAGVDPASLKIVGKYPEIRKLVYDYISRKGKVTREMLFDGSVLGSWNFEPTGTVEKALEADFGLLFR